MKEKLVSLWVDAETEKKYNQLKGTIPDDDILQQYIDDTKKNIKFDLDALDDDLLQYKAKVSKWHKAIKEAYQELTDKSYEIFETFDKNRPSFDRKMEEFVASAKPVKAILNDIEKSILNINTWKIDILLELISRISQMSVKEKEILKFLMTMEGI